MTPIGREDPFEMDVRKFRSSIEENPGVNGVDPGTAAVIFTAVTVTKNVVISYFIAC